MDISEVLSYSFITSTDRFSDMEVDIQLDDDLSLSQAMDDMSVQARERSSSIISNFGKSFLRFQISYANITL